MSRAAPHGAPPPSGDGRSSKGGGSSSKGGGGSSTGGGSSSKGGGSSSSLPRPMRESAVRRRGDAGGRQLRQVCLELIETEQRYHSDLTLIVHTFVQGLRKTAPPLVLSLLDGAEQLLRLHTALGERLEGLALRHRPALSLADAIGAELLAISPYLVLYVDYCARFMGGTEQLASGAKHDSRLAKAIAHCERLATRRRIIDKGATSQVSIYAFLIKPVQRLCQYPLLFREVLKAIPQEAAHRPRGGGAGGGMGGGGGEGMGGGGGEGKGGGGAGGGAGDKAAARERRRPMGGAAPGPRASASVRSKAEYVLAVLEEVARDVNDKVRQAEDGERILGCLTRGGHSNPQAVVAAVFGPAATLVHELKVEIATDGRGHPLGLDEQAALAFAAAADQPAETGASSSASSATSAPASCQPSSASASSASASSASASASATASASASASAASSGWGARLSRWSHVPGASRISALSGRTSNGVGGGRHGLFHGRHAPPPAAAAAVSLTPAKLFIFRDRLLLARAASADLGYSMLACWPLEQLEATLVVPSAWNRVKPAAARASEASVASARDSHASGRGGASGRGSAADPDAAGSAKDADVWHAQGAQEAPSEAATALALIHRDERLECRCASVAEADGAIVHIFSMQRELRAARMRAARRTSHEDHPLLSAPPKALKLLGKEFDRPTRLISGDV